ncbi:MAG: hypothetical protein FJ146_18870 [Deltaproteobacteria bacterium]|nr:hypothetical protein [Deltaproteobacteria bacterium]
MKRSSKVSYLWSLVVTILGASATVASAGEQLQWPRGENVCRGIWTYQEIQECEHPNHGPDPSRPIVETNGATCGYEQKTANCWYGFHHLRSIVIDIPEMYRDHDEYQDHQLREVCHEKAKDQQLNDREVISSWDFEKISGSDRCHKRDWLDKCQENTFFVHIKCHYKVSGPVFGQDQTCGPIDDISRPRSCPVGVHNKLARSVHCPTVPRETTRGFNFTSLRGDSSLADITCSTGDHLPADRPEQVKAKFAFITRKLWSLPSDSHPDWPLLVQGLKALLDARSDMLSDVEKSLANQLVSATVKAEQSVKQGTIFSTADDCVEVFSDDVYRGCRSKLIRLDLDNMVALKKLSSYASLGLKISYDHGCKLHTDELKVRLNSDAANQLLAPADAGNVQWVKLVFTPSGETPTISIDINPAAKISKSCRISIENTEVSLDIKILEQFSDLLISKLTMLNTVKLQLSYPEASPNISGLIARLDDELGTIVTRHQYDCQEEAKNQNLATPALCRVSDDYRSLCHLDPTPANGISAGLFGKIHEDTCLLADLRTLGSEQRCDFYPDRRPGTYCGEHVRTVQAFLDQEYAVTFTAARDLAETLESELHRLNGLSAEMATRIRMVVERMATKISDLEASR